MCLPYGACFYSFGFKFVRVHIEFLRLPSLQGNTEFPLCVDVQNSEAATSLSEFVHTYHSKRLEQVDVEKC